ncbi:MAG: hypothetical protein ACFFBD_03990 [Candidatus Hodarchaeota archaeon]
MNLGDAFSRRKQIDAELERWISRLQLAGRDTLQYETKAIEGEGQYVSIPGSSREYTRTYTIKECLEKINVLIKEDQELARRISLTNQKAKAKLIDLDGVERELSIPELLVLRNEIAPKKEKAARTIPILAKGVEIVEKTEQYTKWRSITPQYKRKQSLSDKGHKIEEEYVDHYKINEVKDYGYLERKVFDEVDKIHEWVQRVKKAINEANKTELVELQ